MNIFHTIILSAVEGITEFLPISSTAHLILVSGVLKLTQTDFLKSFEIVIQFGAILAVLGLYAKKLLTDMRLLSRVVVAFIPTGIVGFILYHFIKKYLIGNIAVVGVMLLLGGLLIILFERSRRAKKDTTVLLRELSTLTYKEAFLLGLFQAIAVIPGTSRSLMIILPGLSMRFSRVAIVEFSFMLAIPTMAAAAGYDLLKTGTSFTGSEWLFLCIGMILSAVVAFIAVKYLLSYIKKHSFIIFGWYRIILGAVVLLVVMLS